MIFISEGAQENNCTEPLKTIQQEEIEIGKPINSNDNYQLQLLIVFGAIKLSLSPGGSAPKDGSWMASQSQPICTKPAGNMITDFQKVKCKLIEQIIIFLFCFKGLSGARIQIGSELQTQFDMVEDGNLTYFSLTTLIILIVSL